MPIVVERGACPLRGLSLPDYAQPKPVGTLPVGPVYTSSDVAELAARLGSPVTFDRRGNVIWFDDFEDGINMWLPGPGTMRWVSSIAKSKGFCMAIDVTGVGHTFATQHRMHYPMLSRLGLEISLKMLLNFTELVNEIRLNDGTTDYSAAVKYNHTTHELSIATSWAGWPVIDLRYETFGAPLFYPGVYNLETLKLVANFVTGYYDRLIINKDTYDISSYPLATYAIVDNPYLAAMIHGVNNSVGTLTVYVDDVIVTQNEPANPVE